MYKLVAHRGYPWAYPENSLIGIKQALDLGANAVEFDVQASADGTPFVFHDENTARLTGEDHIIYTLRDREINKLSGHAQDRFAQQFFPTEIPTLHQVCQLLTYYPDVEVFIEPKSHSLDHLGYKKLMDRILRDSESLGARRRIISFHHEALAYSRANGCPVINWVVDDLSDKTQAIAEQLQPNMLCIDIELVDAPLPKWGDTEWMVYPVNKSSELQQYADWGADYIETDCIGEVLEVMS